LKGFKSPDPLNTKNFPHARLASLRGCDVVDEPAANPNGMFNVGGELAARADAVLSYVLGLSDTAPDEMALGGIEPARARAFGKDFLARNDLQISRGRGLPANITAPALSVPVPRKESTVMADKVEVTPEDALKAHRKYIAELKAAFPKDPAFALECAEEGLSGIEAKAKYADVLQAQLSAKENELAEARKNHGAAPVQFGAGGGQPAGGGEALDFLGAARKHAADKGCSMTAAMSHVASTQPELHAAYVAGAQAGLKK
jgi:hypothetical protein